MATYLPYADFFVIFDAKKFECLNAIAVEGKLGATIRLYSEFRR